MHDLSAIPADRHLLIAGPTASGKSSLAMDVARDQGGMIVNADALQVWSCWRMLTARPTAADEAAVPHALYGHVSPDRAYSVGDWLAEVAALAKSRRLIVVGGTGLYLTALTEGLAPIPPVASDVRAEGDALLSHPAGLAAMIAALDPETAGQIDLRNPARVQRAWEVLQATGRGLAAWQKETPEPLISPADATCLVLDSDRNWLADRIARRFHMMVGNGALDETRSMAPQWAPRAQWARAIGAPELMAHLEGRLTLDEAVEAAIIATRQYAKAQRSWFRNRMKTWTRWSVGE
ncbi:tRNA (adenosine(37)-N6)-dimethylallyltransferase MiaA [Paracoccus sp. TK19116]|uniref:tRNA dimethylallyltransferase n=1 Tax=Paracoccus albicereus TaxID=2922394 RepID=A0ABT1MQC2_9RHOB|nr:tRNA (adenosine(37)-N6)-dimethylallyltransferase MiaA [Paracoccus albicereus]MCQ0970406.1 tRNA (adenosine(37)-N6)-dimethylallyltransferase MiaA [Paracoccus albicereus]